MKPRTNPILQPSNVRRVDLNAVQHSAVRTDQENNDQRQLMRLFRKKTAGQFVGAVHPGFHRWGFSKGQFSLIDIIAALKTQLRHFDAFALSTWTAAQADLTELHRLLTTAEIDNARFLLDLSFQRRQPALIAHIRREFGSESLRVTRNHAKFMLIRADNYNIVVRTSMNLNHNPRLEDIEIKDDALLYEFLEQILNDIWTAHDAKAQITKTSSGLTREFALFEPAAR